jgi:hypothetical protein
MKKKKVTVLASILVSLSFISLPLMGQTATGNEVRAVKSVEETRPGKPAAPEPGEWAEAGKLQLRAAARPWPDSTVTFTTAGERQSKSVYTYDAAGNETLYESYSWEGGTWVNSYKYVYAYDAAGHETLYESYRWEGGTWVNSSKVVCAYDAAGHRTLYESYRWEGGVWVNSNKTVYAYDAAGHEILYEYYTGENNQWKGSRKETYTYDNRGVNVLWSIYNWTNNTWVKSSDEHYDLKTADSKTYINLSVRYDANGRRQSTLLFVTGSGLHWATVINEEAKMEYTATYDANNNLTQVETTILMSGKRVPRQRYVLKYSNNNPVSIEVYDYNYSVNDFYSEAWFKAANTYDARGNRTLSESYQSVVSAMGWIGLNKEVSTYDASGRELSYESYDWNTSSNSWIGNSKYVYTYDANGRELSYESYNWNTSSGGWIGSRKYAYTYDANGRELSYESYDWNTSSGNWIGSWKTTYEERNEYGDAMLSKSWSWKNSGWEWTSYTVYYPGGIGPSGTEYIGGAEPSVYIYGDMLQIRTVSAERIGVYTLNGAKVYESAVSSGTTTVSAERLPKGVLIVRGSSGWARKVYNK